MLQAGLSATVMDARFCKPLDTAMIRALAKEHPVMLTVEEGSIGGFAAHVMQVTRGNSWGCTSHLRLHFNARILTAPCLIVVPRAGGSA